VDALVDREHRAEREEEQRDDEGVEVAVAPVAERVLGGRRAPRPFAAEQQQPWLLVSATECTDSASIDDDPVMR
jgi:hypothetical protein